LSFASDIGSGSAVSGNPSPIQWRVESHGNNYLISLADDERLVLDLSGWEAQHDSEVIVWSKNGGENQDWTFEPVSSTPTVLSPVAQHPLYTGDLPPGTYRIKNRHSKGAVDLAGGKKDPGTPIANWEYHGGRNQQWILESGVHGYKIKSVYSGTYLSFASGLQLASLAAISGNPTPVEWQIVKHGNAYIIVLASNTNLVLDLFESRTNNGNKIILYQKTGNDNQDWIFEAVKEEPAAQPKKVYSGPLRAGTYAVRNAYSNAALDLAASDPAPGTAIANWTAHGGNNQKWTLEPGENGYKIKNVAAGTYLSFASGVPAAIGSRVSGNPTPVEWQLERQENGPNYFIHLASDPKLVLDLMDFKTENGAKIAAYPKNGGQNQLWSFN